MKLYIAHDNKGLIESIVIAESRGLADAYWQGAGVSAITVEQRDLTSLHDHPSGVMPILKTSEYNLGSHFEPNMIRRVIK